MKTNPDEFRLVEQADGDVADDFRHHEYCPLNEDNQLGSDKSTLCMCFELKRADREAAADERYENSRKEF